MSSDLSKYSRLEQSAIHEMANIGLGHAMTALSDLTGHSFNMTVPMVDAVSLSEVPEMMGGSENIAIGVYMSIEGDVSGHMAFIFPWESARGLWKMLLGRSPEDYDDIDELTASAMLETGNIINSSFLDALAELTDLRIHATPPRMSLDTTYSIVSSIVAEAELGDAVALAIKTKIFETHTGSIEGYFLCIPERSSVELFFDQLRVRKTA